MFHIIVLRQCKFLKFGTVRILKSTVYIARAAMFNTFFNKHISSAEVGSLKPD